MKKTILDACCGSRMFWFDKSNPEQNDIEFYPDGNPKIFLFD
jgi:hypothetical protein